MSDILRNALTPAALSRFIACLAAVTLACTHERPLNRRVVDPSAADTLDPKRSPFLKAHMKDGRLYVLSEWRVSQDSPTVVGKGALLQVARGPEERGEFTVALADVALFETNQPDQISGAMVALTVVTGASLAGTAACILNPKACFGSCPTFYVSDGARPVLQAEGFSDSIAPSLEATDVDALYRARPRERRLEIRMTNEALETHVVKQVEVLAVPLPAGGRVFHAAARDGFDVATGGGFYPATKLHAATACQAPEGSCVEALRAFDGRERASAADGANLAAREELELTFPETRAPSLGLVIATRQTLLTTYLLYQGLAYLGTKATEALAALEREPSLKTNIDAANGLLGGIDVLVPDERGGWKKAGATFETGPIATDTHLVRLPAAPAGPTRVRLRLAKGDWRLDWVALVELGARAEPVRLSPRAVAGKTDAGRAVQPRAGEPIVTLPGDAYTFTYELPEHPERYELFLSSRGYYLEWIRERWLSEESALRAGMMLYTPGLALRVLAPDYKKHEPEMERLFWESRYARP